MCHFKITERKYSPVYSNIFEQQTGGQNILHRILKEFPEFSLLLISSRMEFGFLRVAAKYFNCYIF